MSAGPRWIEKALILLTGTGLAFAGEAMAPLMNEEQQGLPSILFGALLAALLMFWRERPALVLTAAGVATLAIGLAGVTAPFLTTPLFTAFAFLVGASFSGRAAWVAGAIAVLWFECFRLFVGDDSPANEIFCLPGYVVGLALRLRRNTANQLAIRTAELEAERELFADLSVRNERARIAAELHDVIGHALSVVVVQAAAGQRLVGRDDDAAASALSAIADSTRQGREDLRRLLDLLGGEEVAAPDISLIDELVARAAANGLDVACRFEGDRDGIPSAVASVAFRVVQESLTNALRYAPGAAVRVLLQGQGRRLRVLVENDPPSGHSTGLQGGGSGLLGLRERIDEVGGTLAYGPTTAGGWSVDATLGR